MIGRVHMILGANGVIGRELSSHVRSYGYRIRQVARTPRREHPTDDPVSADLLDARATATATLRKRPAST
jgi:nucleoside-diphosphate-sugar epimerase